MNQVNVTNKIITPFTAETSLPLKPNFGNGKEKSHAKDIDLVSVANKNSVISALKRKESEIQYNDDVNRLVIRILDSDTKELVRQIPTEDAVDLSMKMQKLVGLLFN